MRPSRIGVSSVLDSLCGKGLDGEAREEGVLDEEERGRVEN